MRTFNATFLWAALVAFFAVSQVLSIHIHGIGRKHAHARHHPGGGTEISSLRVSERDAAPDALSIEMINNLDSKNVHAYIQTTSEGTDQQLLITADGNVYQPVANSKYVATPIPKSARCGIPLGNKGSSVTITMPVSLLTGRIYIADGELDIGVLQSDTGIALQNPTFGDRNSDNFNTSFGFVEANQAGKCIWANPTYVDFVGTPMALALVTVSDTLDVAGLPSNGLGEICGKLADEQRKDGYPWSDLCLKDDAGTPVRILSPQNHPDGFSDYFDDYIDQVWKYITNNGIKFDTQDGNPLVSCHVNGNSMSCDRTSRPFPKPASADVWGCNSGPFAQIGDDCFGKIGARFCAAFHRATFLLPGGAVQPGQDISLYYSENSPHNKYARIVHEVQIDHHGYTFAYDDVNPNMTSPDAEVSGTTSTDGVHLLRITVGGPISNDTQPVDSDSASQASSVASQSSNSGTASTQDMNTPVATSVIPDSSDASTYATRSAPASATPAMSDTISPDATSIGLASSGSLTAETPSIMSTMSSYETTSAYPGDPPIASPLAGPAAKHEVTVVETTFTTAIVYTTTTLLV